MALINSNNFLTIYSTYQVLNGNILDLPLMDNAYVRI